MKGILQKPILSNSPIDQNNTSKRELAVSALWLESIPQRFFVMATERASRKIGGGGEGNLDMTSPLILTP